MMSVNLDDIAVLNINGVNNRCIISGISQCEAVNLCKKWGIIKLTFLTVKKTWIKKL